MRFLVRGANFGFPELQAQARRPHNRPRIQDFFGLLPKQLDIAFAQAISHAPPSAFAPIFRRFLPAKDHADFARFLKHGIGVESREIRMVAASYRALDGCDPRIYLGAARRSILRDLDLSSPDTILMHMRGFSSRQSIFEDDNRIAMPDETLIFGGGSARDMALLLHIALERSTGTQVTTSITETDAFVQAGDTTWSATTLSETKPPPASALRYRWAD